MSRMVSSSAVAAVLVVIVHPLIGLSLTLLLRCPSSTVASAVLPPFAVLPFVRPASITQCFGALVPRLRGCSVDALLDRHVAFLLLASIVVVACNHGVPHDLDDVAGVFQKSKWP